MLLGNLSETGLLIGKTYIEMNEILDTLAEGREPLAFGISRETLLSV